MKLVEIEGLFQADPGAPCPLLIADDSNLRLIFYALDISDIDTHISKFPNEPIVELIFKHKSFFSFSPPNDEAIKGHPYFELGMHPYTFYELLNSDLITRISSYNRFHSYYNPKAYDNSHHYILTFKEQLFECVAEGFEVKQYEGTIHRSGVDTLNQIFQNR